jgi:phosphate transport system substrate-binding protein
VQNASGEPALPDENDSSSGRYPLARSLYVYLGASKGTATDAAAREFMRFVLSEEGQNIARASGAFAITATTALAQRATLER